MGSMLPNLHYNVAILYFMIYVNESSTDSRQMIVNMGPYVS
jgi:hypothetical protein